MNIKFKLTWSNEDFLLIAGSMTTMASIHFNPTDPLFPLTLGAVFKGLFSMLGINLTQTSDEDLVLMIGGFVTLGGIHFDIQNPLFWVTIGAILKAGFGIFGVSPASPIPAPGLTVPAPGSPASREGSLS
jgi:hypothetical protein